MFPFLSPHQKPRWIFLQYYYGVWLNLTMLWPSPYDWVPLEFLKILRGIHTKSPAVCQLHFRFFFPNTGSALMASALDSWLSQDLRILRVLTHLLTEFSCLSFQYLGQLFALCPLLSYGPKKRVADFIVC